MLSVTCQVLVMISILIALLQPKAYLQQFFPSEVLEAVKLWNVKANFPMNKTICKITDNGGVIIGGSGKVYDC